MLVSDLITGSLRLVGKLAPGRTATNSELVAGFSSLSEMLDSWAAERLFIYSVVKSTYSLVATQQSYTIGPGGNFNAPRPVRIEEANVIVAGQRFQVDLLTTEEWARIVDQSVSGQVALSLYNDGAYPLSTLYLYPTPSSSSNSLELFTWQQIITFGSLQDTVTLPQGYLEAMRYNLAVKYASEVGKVPPQVVVAIAVESRARIARLGKIMMDSRGNAQEIAALEAAGQIPVPPSPVGSQVPLDYSGIPGMAPAGATPTAAIQQ